MDGLSDSITTAGKVENKDFGYAWDTLRGRVTAIELKSYNIGNNLTKAATVFDY